MKIFISADIEGVNNIVTWDETEMGTNEYPYFRKQMTDEVANAAEGAHLAGADEILVKDAHDHARNLVLTELPTYIKLHRGWEGTPASMMAGLDKSFDGVVFIGYHSAASTNGNPLSHTMDTQNVYVKINGQIASEFYINALYASYLGVPVIFLSGDLALCEEVKRYNSDIEVVATKEGRGAAVVSKHPQITNEEIKNGVKLALTKEKKAKVVELPKHFKVEIKFKKCADALSASFYPGCVLKEADTVEFNSDDYFEVMRAFMFIL